MKNHCNITIKGLYTDHESEYLSEAFSSHLSSHGMECMLIIHDTPKQNGVAERLNSIFIERVHTLLCNSGLSQFLWGKAVNHAIWLKNQMPTKSLAEMTPYQTVHGLVSDLIGLLLWGAYVWVHNASASKITSQAYQI